MGRLQLLSSYGKEAKFTEYVDDLNLYIFPVLNPDGFVFSRSSSKSMVSDNPLRARNWNNNPH